MRSLQNTLRWILDEFAIAPRTENGNTPSDQADAKGNL